MEIKISDIGLKKGIAFRGSYDRQIDTQGRLSLPLLSGNNLDGYNLEFGRDGDLIYLIREPFGFRADLFDFERDVFYLDVSRNPREHLHRDIVAAEHYFSEGHKYYLDKTSKTPRIILGASYFRKNQDKPVRLRGLGSYFEIYCEHPSIYELEEGEDSSNGGNGNGL